MIIGIGTDLLDIRRIERTLERFGDRFVDRIYTEAERAKAEKRANVAAAYALRYAAKEACSKALGTGLRQGVFWRDMVTNSLPSGKPTMTLTGGALKKLQALTPSGMKPARIWRAACRSRPLMPCVHMRRSGMTAKIEVTMSDEHPMAHAMVIIFAVPTESNAIESE